MKSIPRRVLLGNGFFLVAVGGAQFVFDMLSHLFGFGPLGKILLNSPYTIGFVEAHGLAFMFGALLIRAARRNAERVWHVIAVAIHVLLGGANLLFWPAFDAMGLVTMGIVATSFHVLFAVLEAWCAMIAYRAARDPAPQLAT